MTTQQRCALCSNYGASVQCAHPNCDQLFHYPCAVSVGCFQNARSRKTLCPGHVAQAAHLFDGAGNRCALCASCERLADMLLCTACGQHYHGSCLSPAVSTGAMVRVGWQCAECKVREQVARFFWVYVYNTTLYRFDTH